MTLRELLHGLPSAHIHCAMTGNVVRTLVADGDYCDLKAGDGTEVAIRLDEPFTFEPWFMDRGSVLVRSCDAGVIKLCTEGDFIHLDDDAAFALMFDGNALRAHRLQGGAS